MLSYNNDSRSVGLRSLIFRSAGHRSELLVYRWRNVQGEEICRHCPIRTVDQGSGNDQGRHQQHYVYCGTDEEKRYWVLVHL